MTQWTPRNIIAVAVILLSLGLLYPGLTEPMLNLTIAAKLPFLGDMELYNKTQSIMQSIYDLFDSGNTLVALLILVFSVVIPIMKAICLLIALIMPFHPISPRLHQFVLVIGKWSMADVFVVGLFMAFMAGKAHPSTQAELHAGFYFFLAYCILSILGSQLIRLPQKANTEQV